MSDTAYMEPIVKSQPIRLLDMLVIGPLMIIGGGMLEKQKKHLVGIPLALFGLTTIVYNAMNYWEVKKLEEKNG